MLEFIKLYNIRYTNTIGIKRNNVLEYKKLNFKEIMTCIYDL